MTTTALPLVLALQAALVGPPAASLDTSVTTPNQMVIQATPVLGSAAGMPEARPDERRPIRSGASRSRVTQRPRRVIVDRRAPLALHVNLAATRVDVFELGVRTRSYPIAIGARDFRTPVGRYRVREIVWNPWWYPPPGSAWAANDTVTPPGPGNPMGRVKIAFDDLLYFHGTPQEHSIGSAASHGCLRMRNADVQDLAAFLQRRVGPGLDSATHARLLASPKRTRHVPIRSTVPVTITYERVEVRRDTLFVHPDHYHGDTVSVMALAMQTLAARSYAMSNLDTAALRRALPVRPTRSAAIAVATLFAGSEVPFDADSTAVALLATLTTVNPVARLGRGAARPRPGATSDRVPPPSRTATVEHPSPTARSRPEPLVIRATN